MAPVRMVQAKPEELIVTLPFYQPLLDALEGDETPEHRLVPVLDLQIAAAFQPPEEVTELIAANLDGLGRLTEEFMTPASVLVMERRDGSLWVYDDCPYVAAMQPVHPNAVVACEVYQDHTAFGDAKEGVND